MKFLVDSGRLDAALVAMNLHVLTTLHEVRPGPSPRLLTWCERVYAPVARPEGAGHVVGMWLLDGGDLLRGCFVIDGEGAITGERDTVARGVAISTPIL